MKKLIFTRKKHFYFRKTRRLFPLFFLLFAGIFKVLASPDQVLETEISLHIRHVPLQIAFQQIENQAAVHFVYSPSILKVDSRVTANFEKAPLKQVLAGLLPARITYGVSGNSIVLKPHPQPQQTAYGSVTGMITDEKGNALPYANVVAGKNGTTAGIDGKYNLRLPVGSHTLTVKYIGYVDAENQIDITEDQTTIQDFQLNENVESLQETIVYGNIMRGQAKALNEQKNAINIKNVVAYEQFSKYADRNAAEALQRLPGISISRDQGEGELVSVRGMSPRFNAVQVNGQRIPTPGSGTDRAVGLDLLQVDLMESIVVNKTLTPDMDGDAIGGTVNFNLKQAPEHTILNLSAAAGINQQKSEFRDMGKAIQSYSGVIGSRFFDQKLGLIASGSYYKTDRGSMLHQYTYDGQTTILEEKRSNDYDVERTRYGFMVSPDYRFDENNRLKFVANYNVYDDYEIRRKVDYYFADDEEERETRNRSENQEHYLLQLTGEHHLPVFNLNYGINFTRAEEEMPNRTYYRFARDVNFENLSEQERWDLGVTHNPGGDTPLYLNRVRYDDNITKDKNFSANVDIEFPFKNWENSSLKIGAKYRGKDRTSDQKRYNIGDLDDEAYSIPGGTFGFIDVLYDGRELTSQNLGSFVPDEDRGDGEDFDASEDVTAAYAMGTFALTPKLILLAGLRYEHTKSEYEGIRADDFNETSDFSYDNFLPSAQAKYNFTPNSNLKLAYSSGLTRPTFSSLVPGPDVIDQEERTINRKNSELDPSTANNFDIIYEHYTNNLGLFSIGLFGKFLDDQIQSTRTMEVINGENYQVYQEVNGEKAHAMGIEVAFTHKFINDNVDFLKWIGINANYTYTDTEQTVYDTEGDEIVSRDLPFRSPEHMGNLGLFYENPKIGLSLTVSGVYRSAILDDIGDDIYNDVYLDHEFNLDISASQDITENFSVFLQLNNLTNQQEKEILGEPSEDYHRLLQTAEFGFWGSIGLRYQL
tara:strand:- start:8986 stop:11943 length:2958 start_codon:yes stop_codon:yes gene_type:complete